MKMYLLSNLPESCKAHTEDTQREVPLPLNTIMAAAGVKR